MQKKLLILGILVIGVALVYVAMQYATKTEVSVDGYRYVKWEITEKRGTGGHCIDRACIQVSQFILMRENYQIHWPEGSVALNPGGNSPDTEEPDKMLDGSTGTKWVDTLFSQNLNTQAGMSALVIDMGQEGRTIFDGYKWATANDEPERDPISWKVYGSNNARSWTLLDERKGEFVPEERNTYTGNYVFNLSH